MKHYSKNRIFGTFLCSVICLSPPFFSKVDANTGYRINTLEQNQVNPVKGVIVDSNGESIIGATVRVVGSKQAAVSDVNGNFSIVASKGSTLQISSIGYKTVNIKVTQSLLHIVMRDNATTLKDVQVVAYGVQKKITVTGAISSINGSDLLKTPTGSITNMLAGVVPGLSSIQYSGEPGADAASVLVRGKATWADSSPLIEVDGVERDFNEIDPNEIASITVLKDASATAVFGVRGANGVILITTKRGKEGKAKISFSTSASIIFPTDMLKLADSYDYATYYDQMLKNDAADTKAPFSAAILQKFKDHSDPIRFPDTDWIKYCFKNSAFQSQHNVNISGGTEKVRYFVSLGAYTQDGLFKQLSLPYDFDFKYRRFNYRANLDFTVTPLTTLSVNIGGRVDNKNTPYSGEDNNQLFRHLYWATPFSSPGIIDGKYVVSSIDYQDYQLPFVGASGLGAYYGMGYMAASTNTLNADVILNQKLDFITKGLSFKLKGSYNSGYTVTKQRGASVATYNPILQSDGTIAYRKNGTDSQLGYAESFGKSRDWYMEASLNYNRDFGFHHIGALLLYNQSKKYYPAQYSDIPTGYVGLVGRLTYDYANRYMAEFNAGYNGSENFAPHHRYGFFPAWSVGWVASEESFFKSLKKIIPYLKFRASWGLVGNDKVGGDRFMYTDDPYGLGGGYNFGTNVPGNKSGAYEGAKHNKNVKWETSFKQDYGIDANFLDNHLKATFDYYYENRKDILLQNMTAPVILGFTLPYANLGKVNSWGYEIALKWRDNITDHFTYWVEGNLSYNQNKIIEEYEAPQNYPYMYQKGHRIGSRDILKFWGFYDETADARYFAQYGHHIASHSGGLLPGDCVYVDLNNDGVIDANDRSYGLGHTDDPEYIVGFNIGFTWNKLDVGTQWTGAWDVSRMLDETFRQPLGDTGNKGLLQYQYDHTWTPDNPDPEAKYPRATMAHASNNYAGSTLYEVNSSYLRLKSMDIAYHFDFPFMKNLGMNQCILALSGYNLLTFTGFKWGDPESRTSDRPSYPLTRSFALTLKLGF